MWTPDEQRLIDDVGAALRAKGHATRITIERLLSTWGDVASAVNAYDDTIDDYTNEITSRDVLEEALRLCPTTTLREKLASVIAVIDDRYRAATDDDGGAALAKFFRGKNRDGWWWKRKPRSGPLADFLAARASR